MSKETGLGWTAWSVDDSAGTLRDIRDDTNTLSIALPRGVQDATRPRAGLSPPDRSRD